MGTWTAHQYIRINQEELELVCQTGASVPELIEGSLVTRQPCRASHPSEKPIPWAKLAEEQRKAQWKRTSRNYLTVPTRKTWQVCCQAKIVIQKAGWDRSHDSESLRPCGQQEQSITSTAWTQGNYRSADGHAPPSCRCRGFILTRFEHGTTRGVHVLKAATCRSIASQRPADTINLDTKARASLELWQTTLPFTSVLWEDARLPSDERNRAD